MRAVIFWAPIRALFWSWITVFEIPLWDGDRVPVIPIVLWGPTLLWLIFKPMGYVSYHAKLFFFVLAAIATLVLLVVIAVVAVMSYGEHRGRILRSRPRRPYVYEPPKPAKVKKHYIRKAVNAFIGWSFWELLGEWLKSAHDNMCPPVQFTDEEGKDLPEPPRYDYRGYPDYMD